MVLAIEIESIGRQVDGRNPLVGFDMVDCAFSMPNRASRQAATVGRGGGGVLTSWGLHTLVQILLMQGLRVNGMWRVDIL